MVDSSRRLFPDGRCNPGQNSGSVGRQNPKSTGLQCQLCGQPLRLTQLSSAERFGTGTRSSASTEADRLSKQSTCFPFETVLLKRNWSPVESRPLYVTSQSGHCRNLLRAPAWPGMTGATTIFNEGCNSAVQRLLEYSLRSLWGARSSAIHKTDSCPWFRSGAAFRAPSCSSAGG